MQRDEFCILFAVEKSFRDDALNEYPQAAKCETSNQREDHEYGAEYEGIPHQVANVVLLVEKSILVPGDVGFVVDRSEQRLGFARRERSGGYYYDSRRAG